jgi:transcription elongation factor GreB
VSKAFVKASDEDEDSPETPAGPAPGGPIYMTRRGWLVLKAELDQLVRDERPKMVEVVAWAAGNGDRSENGDYIYGKKRLREIDRRIRFLIKRLENAKVVDPGDQRELDQVFFGATVVITDDDGATEQMYITTGQGAVEGEGRRPGTFPDAIGATRDRDSGSPVRVGESDQGSMTLVVVFRIFDGFMNS